MKKFIDLHCDTLTTAFDKEENLYENNLHIDIKRLYKFNESIQVFSIWLNKKYYEDAFFHTNKFIDFFKNQIFENKRYISLATSFEHILQNKENKKITAILGIEGGESLEDNIENLYYFFKNGVRILTLCWNYENNIGYGVKAGNNFGLKDFGKEILKNMNCLNIIPDVSHLNEKCFWDVCKLSKEPFIASHSNAFNVCENPRNLKDNQLKAIKEIGGIIGINLYPDFLTDKKTADTEDIIRHIDYIGNLIGFESISLGGDFDGIDKTPVEINEITKYSILFERVKEKFGLEIANKIFYENFYKFLEKNFNF